MYNIMYDSHYLQHSLKNLHGLAGYNAIFLLEPAYRRQHQFKSRLHISQSSLAYVKTIINKIQSEQEEKLPGYDTLMLGMLLELMVFFSRQYSKIDIPQAKTLYRVGKIIGLLETQYQKKWDIAFLTKAAGMSKSSLIVAFKNATGYSPIDYLIHIRMKKAAELMVKTRASLYEIAVQCGFHDSNYLSRQFRRVYKLSPRQFRQNNSL